MRESWDDWFIGLTRYVATRSKDPRTHVGSAIVRPDRTIASTGYNGFPRGIEDTPELLENRDAKYERVVHAELNAVLTAREPLHGYTLYCSLLPCPRCAVHVIQAGIARVVAPVMSDEEAKRWEGKINFALTKQLFFEAGVEVTLLPSR